MNVAQAVLTTANSYDSTHGGKEINDGFRIPSFGATLYLDPSHSLFVWQLKQLSDLKYFNGRIFFKIKINEFYQNLLTWL